MRYRIVCVIITYKLISFYHWSILCNKLFKYLQLIFAQHTAYFKPFWPYLHIAGSVFNISFEWSRCNMQISAWLIAFFKWYANFTVYQQSLKLVDFVRRSLVRPLVSCREVFSTYRDQFFSLFVPLLRCLLFRSFDVDIVQFPLCFPKLCRNIRTDCIKYRVISHVRQSAFWHWSVL